MVDIQYELIKLDKSLIWCCYPEQRKKILMKTETEENRNNSINKSFAVLTKIIELINDLKLKIVAEGVETKEMVDALSEKELITCRDITSQSHLKKKISLNF